MNNPSANQKKSTLRDTKPLVRYSYISESNSRVRPWVRQVARALTFFYLVQTIGVLVPAYAQVTPNGAAPAGQRPIMDAANNGTPIVNIAPPSAAGVSRNQYNQFNVDSKGLILNNSRGNTQTQIGGWIAGNPQLGATSARIILNEVVSGNASTLRGTIEVAGQKAGIVIANPNGVTCDGCGFLNTDRASLVAGTPQFGANGSLNGFNVGNGQVNIGAQGLNAANVEQLDLIARGIVIEGEVWAKNLNVIAGNNQVLYGTLQSIAQNGSGSGPAFAIDIKDLGGMYANQIYMVATEQGLGVNSTGRIAALQGNLTLSVNGDLTLKDSYAKQNLQLASSGGSVLKGQTTSDGSAQIKSAGSVVQLGTIEANSGLVINAESLQNSGNITQRGVDNAVISLTGSAMNGATIYSGGKLDINAVNLSDINGKLLAAGDLNIQARSVSLTNTEVISDSNVGVTTSAGDIATSNTIIAAGKNLTANAGGQISNAAGTFQSGGNFALTGRTISNQGTMVANGSLQVATTGTGNPDVLDNTDGSISGNHSVSILGAGILNKNGTISTAGALSIDTQGAMLDNIDGTIVSTNALTLTSGKILNTRGAIASIQSSLNVDIGNQELNNDDGNIQALGNTTIQAGITGNRHGVISGNDLDLKTADLDNTNGQIIAGGKLDAVTTAVTNNGGLMQAVGNININTQDNDVTNRTSGNSGGIVAGGSFTLAAKKLDSRSGYIASNGEQRLTLTGDLDNGIDGGLTAGGQLIGNGKNTIVAANVSNVGGQIAALDDVSIATLAGQTDNRGGSIASSGNVTLSAQAVLNGSTNSAVGTIDGKDVSLAADTVSNVGGIIRSTQDSKFDAAVFNNTNGVVSSERDLKLNSAQITNLNGKIVGGKEVVVETAAGNIGGNLSSMENLTLTINGNYVNSGTVAAEKNLTVIAANIENNGALSAGQKLTANTGDLVNAGEISAIDTTLNVAGTATNTATGLIDGNTTIVNANIVNNTGRIFGDLLKIQVDTLNNSGAGVIAAREKLLIGARNVNNTNGGSLYSLKDISFARSFDGDLNPVGEVDRLINGSSTIEAAAGDIRLAVKDLINRNDQLVTRTITTFESVNELIIQPYSNAYGNTTKYRPVELGWDRAPWNSYYSYVWNSSVYPFAIYGSNTRASAFVDCPGEGCNVQYTYANNDPVYELFGVPPLVTSDLAPDAIGGGVDCDQVGSDVCRDNATYRQRVFERAQILDGRIWNFNNDLATRSFDDWYEYWTTGRSTTETFIDSTKPAKILAGGAINIVASGSVLNDNSNIVAGGAIAITGANVENRGTQGSKSVTETGYRQIRYVTRNQSDMDYYEYTPTTGAPIVTTTTLAGFKYESLSGSIPSSDLNVARSSTLPNASLATAGVAVGVQNVATTPKTISASLANNTSPLQTINPQLQAPNSNLFALNSAPNATSLFKTDSRFLNQRDLLSSDYYLAKLNQDPERQLKRYGDGFLEQQLVNDQILALTGRRYLSGYTNTESEYKGLMDAGIAFAQQYQISPGVSLSAEQMALLTTDIVLLTTQKVTLADGSTQEVLVPQVYLRRPQAGDLLPSGGLIAGSDVYIKSAGDLVNTGQISADNENTLLAGKDLLNRDGRISGQDVYARAGNDLKNISGVIQGTGANSIVALSAGRDVILETRTIAGQTERTATTSATSRVNADRIATVQGGTITIDAGRDMIGKGSAVQADSNLSVTAGRDLKVSAVETSYSLTEAPSGRVTKGRQSYREEESVKNELATFNAGGNVNLIAGTTEKGDLALKGVNVSAGDSVTLQGSNVSIEAVKDSELIDVQRVAKNKYQRTMQSDETIAGGEINAGKGINIHATGAPGATQDASGAPTVLAGTGDVLLSGAKLNAIDGKIAVVANNNVIAEAMTTEHSTANEYYKKSKGFLKTTTRVSNHFVDRTDAEVSTISSINDAVTISAGNNVLFEGTRVDAKKDITITAGNQLFGIAAYDTLSESKYDQKFTSGIHFSFSGYPVAPETKGKADGKDVHATSAQGMNVSSGSGNVTLFGGLAVGLEGAQLRAEQGDVAIGGGVIDIRAAVDSINTDITHVDKGNKMNLIALHKFAEGPGSESTEKISTQETVLSRTNIEGNNVAITAIAGDAHIAGTTIETPGTLALNAPNGVVALDGQQTEITTSKTSEVKDIVYQKVKGEGGTEQVTDYNIINAGTVAISAPKITAQIGSKDSVAQLAAQPGMEWINTLTNDPAFKDKVDWKKLEDASKHWDYKAQGLTAAGAVIVTIIVTWLTAGGGSGAAGGATGGTAGGTTAGATAGGVAGGATAGATTGGVAGGVTAGAVGGTATGAAAATSSLTTIINGATAAAWSTLASQAAIALINNQGDLGGAFKDLGSSENIKGLIAAAITGGVLARLNMPATGEPVSKGGTQAFTTQLSQNLQAGAAKAVINTAIYGGSLEDNLKSSLLTAFVDTAAAQGANAIGDMTKAGTLNAFANKIAHAIAGCAVGTAKAGNGDVCGAGALGAVIGELAAEGYGTRTDTTQFAAMLSGIAAAVAGLDAGQINIASQTGANAAANNYLKHSDVAILAKKMADCGSDLACRNNAMDEAYRASTTNDIALLNCKATNSCETLKAEYRKGYESIIALVDSGFNSQEAMRILDMESNAQIIIRNNLNNCKSASCQEKANYLTGVGKGLIKITPVGMVSGVGIATYQLTTAILENGLSDTAAALASGIADLPANLKANLTSTDPVVRGEALVDALSVGTVATSIAIKLGAATWQSLSKSSLDILADANSGFKTLGLTMPAESAASGREMIATLQKAGMPVDDAMRIANDMFKTSATVPETIAVNAGDQLIKLVPTGAQVRPTSPFWLTQAELTALAKEPSKLAERLGLPPSSQASSYDIYVIQAKGNTSVFESTVAKTIDSASGKTQSGGANQTIVLDRTKFTNPVKVGNLSVGQ